MARMAAEERAALRALVLVVAAVALLGYAIFNAIFNGRSDVEQNFYERGYDYADGMIEEFGADSRDDVITACGLFAQAQEMPRGADTTEAFADGCHDRWDDN